MEGRREGGNIDMCRWWGVCEIELNYQYILAEGLQYSNVVV